MFLFVVLPSVFPLCVLSDWLVRTGGFRKLSRFIGLWMKPLFGVSGMGALSLITSWIGSYPTAAKTTAQLYKNGEISYEDALKLSAFTNNAGPLFIIGVIGTNMLHSTFFGIFLWIIHILASFLTGILMKNCYKTHQYTSLCTRENSKETGEKANSLLQLSTSIASAMETMVPVCGTVLFFASLCAIIESQNFSFIQPLNYIFELLLEMTTGCQTVSSFSFFNLSSKAILMTRCCLYAGVVSWGGCSVHMQIMYIFSQSGLSCTRYMIGKMIHTLFSVLLTSIGCLILL